MGLESEHEADGGNDWNSLDQRGIVRGSARGSMRLSVRPLSFLAVGALLVFLVDQGAERPASESENLLGTHPDKILAVAVSHDGRRLASGGYGGSVLIWNLAERRVESELEGSPAITSCLAFSSDDARLVGGEDGAFKIWETRSWTLLRTVRAHSGTVRSLSFSPDGDSLATVGFDGDIALWDVATWQIRRRMPARQGPLGCVAFSPDGTSIASNGLEGNARLWEAGLSGVSVPVGQRLLKAGEQFGCLAFSPDGRLLAIPRSLQPPELWDPAGGRRLATLERATSSILSFVFSPDGRFLAAGTIGGAVEVWEVATGKRQTASRLHDGAVWALAFTPDGRSLISGGYDGTLKLWQLERDPGPGS